MFNNIKKNLYFRKSNLLFKQGLMEKKIVPFDDEFYEKMSHTYFNGIPISMHIKYLKPLPCMDGKCYDRSLFMFFCFPEAILCRGDIKNLELSYGKEKAGHGWIEMGDYVYDPTLLMRFEKELYYNIYMPFNVIKTTTEEYCLAPECKALYDDITKTTIQDLQTPGVKRINLIASIPTVQEMAEMSNNPDFVKELNEHLASINYDIQQILDDFDLAVDGQILDDFDLAVDWQIKF